MKAWLAVALVACGGGKGGGTPDGQQTSGGEVGRVCDPGDISPNETAIASPALECASRECLTIANSTPAMCTASCSDASDCSEALESACAAGFACAPVTSVGPFACESFCVCADRVPFTSCS